MFHDLISFKKTYFYVYTFCISLHDIHFVYTIFSIFHQFFLMMIPDVVYAFCISSIFPDGNYVKIWPFLYIHFVYHAMIYTLYIIILYRHFAYTILPWNLGCIFHVDFGIQIWYAFCICRNHLILEMILLLFKLNDWCIKWHDGHGLVIRLIDYGHILIDATFLVFLIYWMYIIHPFFIDSVVFVGLWPCFAFTILFMVCSVDWLFPWTFPNIPI